MSYPDQFPPSVWEHVFTTIPQDVWQIQPSDLHHARILDQSQWFVIGGFECQDLSHASGHGKGLQGHRSNTFYPLCHIIGYMQSCQSNKPPFTSLRTPVCKCLRTLFMTCHTVG